MLHDLGNRAPRENHVYILSGVVRNVDYLWCKRLHCRRRRFVIINMRTYIQCDVLRRVNDALELERSYKCDKPGGAKVPFRRTSMNSHKSHVYGPIRLQCASRRLHWLQVSLRYFQHFAVGTFSKTLDPADPCHSRSTERLNK